MSQVSICASRPDTMLPSAPEGGCTAMSAAASGRVFISYRRQESSGMAGRLYDRLAGQFGQEQVFMDVDTIALGVDFAEVITEAVSTCKVLLAIIGPAWVSATDQDDRRRLEDPDDIVRLEIAAALERDIRVIPILVEGAQMPRRHELPKDLARLARRNALSLRHESFRSDADRLLEAIEPILRPPTAAGGVPSGPAGTVTPPSMTPRLELSATAVDFGSLPAQDKSPERRVRLINAGGGTLIAQEATSASWLELRQEGDELVIGVDTTMVGEHDGVVTVDSDGGSARIRVKARVDPPPQPTSEPAATTQPKVVSAAAERSQPGPQEEATLPDASKAAAPTERTAATPAPSRETPASGPGTADSRPKPASPFKGVYDAQASRRSVSAKQSPSFKRVALLIAVIAIAILVVGVILKARGENNAGTFRATAPWRVEVSINPELQEGCTATVFRGTSTEVVKEGSSGGDFRLEINETGRFRVVVDDVCSYYVINNDGRTVTTGGGI